MLRMLIVDDEIMIVDYLFDLVSGRIEDEIEICKAYTPLEALQQAYKGKFDIVLADIQMPGMNGLELQEKLLKLWPRCKFIFLTGHNEFEYARVALKNQSSDYILKTEGDQATLDAVMKAIVGVHTEISSKSHIERAYNQLRQALPFMQKEYLLDYLQRDSNKNWSSKRFNELDFGLNSAQKVFLLIAKVDEWTDSNLPADRLMLYAVQNIAEEYLESSVLTYSFDYNKSRMIWFLQQKATEDSMDWDRIVVFVHGTMELIQTSCRKLLNMKISIAAASSPVDWVDIPVVFGSLNQLFLRDLGMRKEQLLIEKMESSPSPLTKQIFGDDGGLAFQSSTFGGKLMGIPQTNPTVNTQPFVWIREDWLQKLNLPEPKNMADLLKISEAFTTQDPDGNGKNDTFGIAADKGIYAGGGSGLNGFFNGYHAYPDIWVKDASGQLVWGGIQPEIKSALAQLQLLYKNGQIDKEFAVKDGTKVAESIDSDKIGITFGPWWLPVWPLQQGVTQNPKAIWKPLPLLSSDDQKAQPENAFYVSSYYVVKKGSLHPEVLIKLFNTWFDKMYGPDGDYLTYGTKADGSLAYWLSPVYAWPPNRLSNDRGDHIIAALKDQDASKLNAEEKSYYDKILLYKKGDVSNWNMDALYGDLSAWPAWHTYSDNNAIMQDEFYGAPTPAISDHKTALDKLQSEEYAKIILGSASPDDFDNFVASWKKLGGDQMTKEVNDWHAAMK